MQCVRSSHCIYNLFIIYLFLKHLFLNVITRECLTFLRYVSNVIHGNVTILVLRDSGTDSENVNFIRRSVSDGQKTCSSKGVSLTGI